MPDTGIALTARVQPLWCRQSELSQGTNTHDGIEPRIRPGAFVRCFLNPRL